MVNDESRLIIIPAFDESPHIEQVVGECKKLGAWDVVVVDDGSRDDSAQRARRAGAIVIRLPINLGIGGAMKAGYRFAHRRGYQWVAQIDGDGQHDPAQLETLWQHRHEGDCLIGSRFLVPRGYRSSPGRVWGIRAISCVLWLFSGKRLRDVTSGMRLVNREVLALFQDYYPIDYPEPESTAMLLKSGFRVVEVPVIMQARQGGESSIRGWSNVFYMLKVIPKVALSCIFRRYPWHRGS